MRAEGSDQYLNPPTGIANNSACRWRGMRGEYAWKRISTVTSWERRRDGLGMQTWWSSSWWGFKHFPNVSIAANLWIANASGLGVIKPFCSPGNRPRFFKGEAADRYSLFAVSVPKSSCCQILQSAPFEVLYDFLNFLFNVSSSLNWHFLNTQPGSGLAAWSERVFFPSMTISTCQHRLACMRNACCRHGDLWNGGLTDSDGSFRLLAIWPRFHRTSKSVRLSLLL